MEELKEYLLNNEDKLLEVVNDLNSWNGSFENLYFYENDKYVIDELFPSAYDFAEKCACGDYNINDEYFRIDGYGNIESCNEYEMIQDMKDSIDDIIDALKDEYTNLDIDDELINLIEAPEKEEKFSSLDDLIKGATEKSNEQPLKEEKSLEMER